MQNCPINSFYRVERAVIPGSYQPRGSFDCKMVAVAAIAVVLSVLINERMAKTV